MLRRSPWTKRLAKRAMAALLRIGTRPRELFDRRVPEHLDPELLLARTDELNAAAERYYAEYPDPEFILDKPFTEEEEFPRRLFDLGVLFHALRLSPNDVVLELGAGSCWVSHFLNRYGCKTIAVDVSETALGLGRELFRRSSLTRWDAEPEFVVYDGRRIPLPDGACDKIVINDAFHHFPNPAEVLGEMARVLSPGGIVAMVEPGPGHADTEDSRREVETTGVLENEIVLGRLDAMARRAGFTEVALVPLSLSHAREVPVAELGTVSEVEGLLDQWAALAGGPHYIVLHKGRWLPTTRSPEELDARIEILDPLPREGVRAAPGESVSLRIGIANRGDTRWLATAVERPGWTRLGVHLHDASGELLDFNWLRASLPGDLDPGEEARMQVELPAIGTPGTYRLVFDLVAEHVLWFEQSGSRTVEVRLEVV